ncbi:MAG TPA: NUDIX domain-containing protein [Sphingomicrobium sp.]|nr:NUDIX domain-containing protein [Sphingomicrobium sp.]
MAAQLSAGILLYRGCGGGVEVLLTHPGGPYWRNKQLGAWMIPKGGVDDGESPADAAVREFEEELGTPLAVTPFRLCRVRQSGGKNVEVFAARGDFDCASLSSMEFEMEWPPRTGEMRGFPEIDEARWMGLAEARRMMLPSQLPILDALEEKLRAETGR